MGWEGGSRASAFQVWEEMEKSAVSDSLSDPEQEAGGCINPQGEIGGSLLGSHS